MKRLKKMERTAKNEDFIKEAETWMIQGQVFGFIKDVLSVTVQEDAVVVYYEDDTTAEAWLESNIEKQKENLQRLREEYSSMVFDIAAHWAYEERTERERRYQKNVSEGNAYLKRLQTRLSERREDKPAASFDASVTEVLRSKYRKQLHAAENWLSTHPNDAPHLVQREVLLEIIRDLEAL